MFKYPDRKKWYPEEVDQAPDATGVYGIFTQDKRCVYVGGTYDSIRTRLQAHKNGNDNTECIKNYNGYYYVWETKSEIGVFQAISEREKELIAYYKNVGQAYCNERVG